MKSPFTEKEMTLVKEWRKMTYRKEAFNVYFHFYRCEDTGEQFEDEDFSKLNYNQVVNQYRVKHRIPFPDQIREIRQKYGLSAMKMSDVMGMGPNSWRNYEADEVPSKVHANLIQMISTPENFREYIEKFSEVEAKEREKILKQVQKLELDNIDCLEPLLRFEYLPDITTGFKSFNKEIVKSVILFYAEQLKPFKTKLNKLLFYTDFVHFRKYSKGITGLKYAAFQYGPVPDKYDVLFGLMSDMDYFDIEYDMSNYGEVERILPNPANPFIASFLTPMELETLELVLNRFKTTSSSEIADISHKEKAWKDNVEGKKIIPYYYSFELETI